MRVPASRSQGRRQGAAIVIMLVCLVLLSGLVLALLSSMKGTVAGTKTDSDRARARRLADTAMNLVKAQIRSATSGTNGLAWASQPGAIHTFDSQGSLATIYKLYSDDDMAAASANSLLTDFSDLANWDANAPAYTDLNQPQDLGGRISFPIIDPRAHSNQSTDVVGFSYSSGIKGTVTADEAADPALQRLPMPVRWIYVLEDGSLTVPDASGVLAGATKQNPIVGRVAFWTDDESCKININTAAGDEWSGTDNGSFWDVPRISSNQDRSLALSQPAADEFQRYPGHPATTYLSAVFPDLKREQIATIAPRIAFGGSKGGTNPITSPVAIGLDHDRLYASVDELIYAPGRSLQSALGIDEARLKLADGFLTANSRSPEVNLFNRPRVSIWPLASSVANRTALDSVFAFCATVGNEPYYFVRENANSTTQDIGIARNHALLDYLSGLAEKPIPGFGGKFSDKYGVQGIRQIFTETFDYIRMINLYDDSNPAYRFTKARKSPGSGQIAPSIDLTNGVMGFGRYYALSDAGFLFICTADGSVTSEPSNLNSTDGLKWQSNQSVNKTLEGVVPLSSTRVLPPDQKRVEAVFLLEYFCPALGWSEINPEMEVDVEGLENVSLNGQFLGFPSAATVVINQGAGATSQGRSWGGVSGVKAFLKDKKVPARGSMIADAGPINPDNVYPFVSQPVTISKNSPMTLTSTGAITVKIYIGRGGDRQLVQTYTIMPDINMSMPVPDLVTVGAATIDPHYWWTFSRDGAIPGKGGDKGRLAGTVSGPSSDTNPTLGNIFRTGDVVRSWVLAHGDPRLVATRNTIGTDVFVAHPKSSDPTVRLAHNFTNNSTSATILGNDATAGFVPGAVYNTNKYPDIPNFNDQRVTTMADATGDWDTSISINSDGAYINKPDDGNLLVASAGNVPYYDSDEQYAAVTPSYFSPNRQVPSPVMFGSLSTGLFAPAPAGMPWSTGVPWRTLLFRPDDRGNGHEGAQSPPDYLLLDLFWMPVVTPYAISEPLSTAGKVNMNYALAPFSNILRATALIATMRSEQILAIPQTSDVLQKYKIRTSPITNNLRLPVDVTESESLTAGTLSQFQARFAAGGVFRSEAEICGLYLVPRGQTLAGMPAFWAAHKLSGDDVKERPYADLYPRLTTKSNVFKVHVKAQALQKVPSTAANRFETGRDTIRGEWRGSFTIERYIDLSDPALPDFTDLATSGLGQFYKFRTIAVKQFTQ